MAGLRPAQIARREREKQSAQRRAAVARANGAKSHGPLSPETKSKSAQNSLRHGFTATNTPVLLKDENPAELQALAESFYADLHPNNPVETALVDRIVQGLWRVKRVQRFENQHLIRRALELQPTRPNASPEQLFAAALLSTRSAEAPRYLRYATQAQSLYRRALRQLLVQRRNVQNEPIKRINSRPSLT